MELARNHNVLLILFRCMKNKIQLLKKKKKVQGTNIYWARTKVQVCLFVGRSLS